MQTDGDVKIADLKFIVGNVGNTYAEFAVFDGEEISELERIPTQDLLDGANPAPMDAHPQYPIVAATVVPAVVPLPAMSRVIWMHAGLCGDFVDFTPVDPFTLGADRVANAMAAVHLLKLPALVVDFGTAITFELIDANKVFRGGAIMPGRQLMRQALNANTAQLPSVPLTGQIPTGPGTNTEGAIRLGVDVGLLGAVDRVIRELTKELPDCTVVAVGGDRDAFLSAGLPLERGPDHLTLKGVGVIAMDLF